MKPYYSLLIMLIQCCVLNVSAQTNSAPQANFSVANIWILEGDSASFSDISSGSPTQWHWTLEGATLPYSTTKNPKAQYLSHGTYAVKLKVANQWGADSITRQGYIHVLHHVSSDTLESSMADTTLFLADSGGYIGGTNYRQPLAIAKKIKVDRWYCNLIEGVLYYLKVKSDSSFPATFAIWDDSGQSGAPGLLRTQTNITLDSTSQQIAAAFYHEYFDIPNTSDSISFYFGFLVPNSWGDTVAFYASQLNESLPGTAWEQQANGDWIPLQAAWGLNLDLSLEVVCSQYINSISNSNALTSISISPNPSNGNFTLHSQFPNAQLSIVNALGQVVLNQTLTHSETEINLEEGGLYCLQVTTPTETKKLKLLVNRE